MLSLAQPFDFSKCYFKGLKIYDADKVFFYFFKVVLYLFSMHILSTGQLVNGWMDAMEFNGLANRDDNSTTLCE